MRWRVLNGALTKCSLDKPNSTSKIYNCSASSLSKRHKKQVDLIVTDPPYADHAPYLEYSDFYWSIISGQRTKPLWGKEIVKTNAIERKRDSDDYESRMSNSFKSILSILKDNGYLVFFYVDKNIYHWEIIKSAVISSGCIIEDVIAISKQRRSMKTVTSPGKTLDGDLIVICKKTMRKPSNKTQIMLGDLLCQISGDTYFERYGSFIKKYLMSEVLDLSEWNLNNISRLL